MFFLFPFDFRLSLESQQTHHHPLVKEELVKVEDEEIDPVEVPESKMPLSPSVEFLDDDDDEYEDDEFNDAEMPHATLPMRPPTTSISTIRLSQQDRVQ